MDDASPTLLLTRPDAQSRGFLAECEARAERRLPAVIAPVMRILDVGDVPDLDLFGSVLVTSSHAVRRLSDSGAMRGHRVFTVGEMTAALARADGADASALGEDIDGFLRRTSELVPPCLYARGRHVRLDLRAELVARGFDCEEAVIYDQVAQPIGRAGRALLAGGAPVVAPLFSARSAELLSASTEIKAPVTALAMSEAVAAAWNGGGDVRVVPEPTSAAMCAAVADYF
ncbi:MAG: uroporphyrinogen-III synthase [Boseongicola sp.]|nr:uroporphyrinogen-III synthase [Boseongicola sp.]